MRLSEGGRTRLCGLLALLVLLPSVAWGGKRTASGTPAAVRTPTRNEARGQAGREADAAMERRDPFRLSGPVRPTAQEVALTLDPSSDGYAGSTRIDLRAEQGFRSFRLHAHGLRIASAVLVDQAGHRDTLVRSVVDSALGLVALEARRPRPAGRYDLIVEFQATYGANALGIYRTRSRGDDYVFSQFQDRHARQAFPCWDEPAFKIPWRIVVRSPDSLLAVSNAPVAASESAGGWTTTTFAVTPPMPSYLVALAVGPFDAVEVPGLGVPGRILTPRGQSRLAAEAARLSPGILKRLEDYFAMPYPFAKLDQLAVPEYVYGAMENPGLVTYHDHMLLLDPDAPPLDAQRGLVRVMAHELAHMWFGNLVTMRWWNDLWLNESFAEWLCGRIADEEHPAMRSRFAQRRGVRSAMRTDALPSAEPVRRAVTAASDYSILVDDLTYGKGSGILSMVERWIGRDKFREAMRGYVRRHSWANATADDLWDAFDSASGEDVSRMMAGYVGQAGVPLVSLSAGGSASPDAIRLRQRRLASQGGGPVQGRWIVPVVIRWSRGGIERTERLLLADSTAEFAIEGIGEADWIHPDADDAGYYRWHLSPEAAQRLSRHAASLTAMERVGLLDNTAHLLQAGLADGAGYAEALLSVTGDGDAEVNTAQIFGLAYLHDALLSSDAEKDFRAAVVGATGPMLDRVGLRPPPGETAASRALRRMLFGFLGREIEEPQVVGECHRLARAFLKDPAAVDPGLVQPALVVSAFHGDSAYFDSLHAALGGALSPSARGALVQALGSFHDPSLARRALALSLTPALNSTEFLGIVGAMTAEASMRPLAVDWILANYDAIAAKAPPEYVARLISHAARAERPVFERLDAFLSAPGRVSEAGRVNIRKARERFAQRESLRAREAERTARALRAFAARTKGADSAGGGGAASSGTPAEAPEGARPHQGSEGPESRKPL